MWKGKWQGEAVAIKELNSTTDKTVSEVGADCGVDLQLFIREVDVWRRLKSPHVLPFFGASSTTGPPPWFLVSPFSTLIAAGASVIDDASPKRQHQRLSEKRSGPTGRQT